MSKVNSNACSGIKTLPILSWLLLASRLMPDASMSEEQALSKAKLLNERIYNMTDINMETQSLWAKDGSHPHKGKENFDGYVNPL